VLDAAAATNSQGIAAASGWILGTAPGTNTLTATVGSLPPVTFTATATAGPPAKLALVAGDAQQGDVGQPLASALVARVGDAFGNPLPNVNVSFAVSAGSGTLSSSSVNTDAQGRASTLLTLSAAGVTTVTATAASLAGSSVVFTASTGPTITGQVVGLSGVVRPFAGTTAFRTAPDIKATGLPDKVLAGESRALSVQTSSALLTSGRLVVTYKPDAFALPAAAQAYRISSVARHAAAAYAAALLPYENAGLIRRREISPAIGAALVQVAPGQNRQEVINALRRDARVQAVEEDGIASTHTVSARPVSPELARRLMARHGARAARRTGSAAATPATERYADDPLLYAQLWHYSMVDAPRAWAVHTGSNTVLVGTIDVGIRSDHPAVASLISATGQYDFVSNDIVYAAPQMICGTSETFSSLRGTAEDEALPRNSAQQPRDVLPGFAGCWALNQVGAHGTHVAGTIGSPGNDGIGGVGLNWAVRIRPVRALGITGQGFYFDVAQAILYQAGLPAAVPGSTTGETVQATPAAIINMSLGGGGASTVMQNAVTAASVNSLIIASAGNSASSTTSIPAAYSDVLSVVALGPDYQLAWYTNVGAAADIAAPGGDFRIGSSAGVVSSTWNFATNSPNYAYYQGTSMATPHVTGVAALVLAANPGLTPQQLRARLEQGAVDLGPPGRDNRFGAGLVNAYNSVTGRSGPLTSTNVRAVNAATGAVARSGAVAADGRFTFARLADGAYYVVGAQDEANDGVFGAPGRRFNWFGAGGMGTVNVAGSGVQTVALALGAPLEAEPNDDNSHAQPLVVNAWVAGQLTAPDPKDVFTVVIPSAGTYTFETSGVVGACGQAIDVDTVLRLYDAGGTLMGSNDDTSWPIASYPSLRCSRVSMQLPPGRYFVEVGPATATAAGTYRLHVRQGN
jgi:subtilisin family serine protease